MKLKKGDRVKVIAGNDKGAIGEIIDVDPKRNRVTVQGVNIVTRHQRDWADPSTGATTRGGRIQSEAPIHASNVALVVRDENGEEVVTRIGTKRIEETRKNSSGEEHTVTRGVRIARKTGKEI